jgi:hypothetical protein
MSFSHIDFRLDAFDVEFEHMFDDPSVIFAQYDNGCLQLEEENEQTHGQFLEYISDDFKESLMEDEEFLRAFMNTDLQ